MILVYHRVDSSAEKDFLDLGGVPRITPENLQMELGFLVNLGVRFMSFQDLREGEFPDSNEIGVIVSFDDGFRDTYEQGLPVVEAVGARATVFQCTAMIEAEQALHEHRLYLCLFAGEIAERQRRQQILVKRILPERATSHGLATLLEVALTKTPFKVLHELLAEISPGLECSTKDLYPDRGLLRHARSAGHEIGSHGHRHLHRNSLSDAEFESELQKSVADLESVLGRSPQVFSYPFGASAPGDAERCRHYFGQLATCERRFITPHTSAMEMGRFSWPGTAPNRLRLRRWLLTGSV